MLNGFTLSYYVNRYERGYFLVWNVSLLPGICEGVFKKVAQHTSVYLVIQL